MATINRYDESLVERDEVVFPNTHMIDTEPFYNNFTTIQNFLRNNNNKKKQLNKPIDSINNPYQINRIRIKPYFNKLTSSQIIDGYIFNLIQIVEDIGYNPKSPFIHSSQNNNNDALSNLILKLGGAHGPLVNIRRLNINKHYFQRWYLKKHPRSASLTRYRHILKKTTQKPYEYKSTIYIQPSVITNLTSKQMDEKHFQNDVLRMYGFDDVETTSSISSRRSSIDENNSTPIRQPSPELLETIDHSKPKQQITIREYYPSKDMSSLMVNRSLSPSSQQTIDDNEYEQFLQNNSELYNDQNPEIITEPNPDQVTYQQTMDDNEYEQFILNNYNNTNSEIIIEPNPDQVNYKQTIDDNEYEQFLQNNSELYHDPNPEIITKPNPDQVTYKQNVSVRYLVPPTPPPPGPLIIREIVPPRAPTPPPFVIKHQEPSPPTPPPLVLREAPPLPPPNQEAKIITKVLPQEPPPAQRVIIERTPPLPPKPQSIIIEKWLPYKPPPPREVIYERVTEIPVVSEFQPGSITTDHQRHHSADYHSKSSSRLPIPVHIERQNSCNHLATQHSSVFDQFARSTQQQLHTIQAHQHWMANQHQRHMNMFRRISSPLTTPTLIVHYPPVTKTATAYMQREEILYKPTFIYT